MMENNTGLINDSSLIKVSTEFEKILNIFNERLNWMDNEVNIVLYKTLQIMDHRKTSTDEANDIKQKEPNDFIEKIYKRFNIMDDMLNKLQSARTGLEGIV